MLFFLLHRILLCLDNACKRPLIIRTKQPIWRASIIFLKQIFALFTISAICEAFTFHRWRPTCPVAFEVQWMLMQDNIQLLPRWLRRLSLRLRLLHHRALSLFGLCSLRSAIIGSCCTTKLATNYAFRQGVETTCLFIFSSDWLGSVVDWELILTLILDPWTNHRLPVLWDLMTRLIW